MEYQTQHRQTKKKRVSASREKTQQLKSVQSFPGEALLPVAHSAFLAISALTVVLASGQSPT